MNKPTLCKCCKVEPIPDVLKTEVCNSCLIVAGVLKIDLIKMREVNYHNNMQGVVKTCEQCKEEFEETVENEFSFCSSCTLTYVRITFEALYLRLTGKCLGDFMSELNKTVNNPENYN